MNPFDLTEAVTEVERAALALGEQVQRIVTIGGDHTVALPCCARWPRSTVPSPSSISTPTWTRGTPTSAPP